MLIAFEKWAIQLALGIGKDGGLRRPAIERSRLAGPSSRVSRQWQCSLARGIAAAAVELLPGVHSSLGSTLDHRAPAAGATSWTNCSGQRAAGHASHRRLRGACPADHLAEFGPAIRRRLRPLANSIASCVKLPAELAFRFCKMLLEFVLLVLPERGFRRSQVFLRTAAGTSDPNDRRRLHPPVERARRAPRSLA